MYTILFTTLFFLNLLVPTECRALDGSSKTNNNELARGLQTDINQQAQSVVVDNQAPCPDCVEKDFYDMLLKVMFLMDAESNMKLEMANNQISH